MKRFYLFFCLSILGQMCGAQGITILPQLAVGDTLEYHLSAQMKMQFGNDSLMILTKLRPRLVVDSKNDKGFVVTVSNTVDSVDYESSESVIGKMLMAMFQSDLTNDFIGVMVPKIQLDEKCRPDSVLNLDDIKDRMVDAFAVRIAEQQGVDPDSNPAWKWQVKPAIMLAVNKVCGAQHLIEIQFGNIPYFNLIGIPLRTGKILASEALTEDTVKMISSTEDSLEEVDIEVKKLIEAPELDPEAKDGFYSIKLVGETENSGVECRLLYSGGVLNRGRMSVYSDTEGILVTGQYLITRLNSNRNTVLQTL